MRYKLQIALEGALTAALWALAVIAALSIGYAFTIAQGAALAALAPVGLAALTGAAIELWGDR